jgi:uncharacterized protein
VAQPVSDLATLLAQAAPALSANRYSIETVSRPPDMTDGVFALIREDEGLTLIRDAADGDWARITMTIMSDLAAVGFTAAFAHVLGARGIPANVVAAYYHDHILVPWAQRDDAMAALSNLSD